MNIYSIKHSLAAKRMAIALIGVLACGSYSAYAAGEFTSIGEKESSSSEATAISADGTVVVGNLDPDANSQAFRWTETGGLRELSENRKGSKSNADDVNKDGTVIGGDYEDGGSLNEDRKYSKINARGISINKNGTFIVGFYEDGGSLSQAFYWTQASNIQALGGDELTSSEAHGVSADGEVIVGWGKGPTKQGQAYRWMRSPKTGEFVAEHLKGLGGPKDKTRANGVSADGKVVVGYIHKSGKEQFERAFHWTEDSVLFLGTLGGSQSVAHAANKDGTVVVGWSTNSDGNNEAFRWEKNSDGKGGSTMEGLGLGGGTESRAHAVSADGKVVVGYFEEEDGDTAFRWTEAADKMISVEEWLQGAGVATTGFERLERANGVSEEGNTVVGRGVRNNRKEAYIARVIPITASDAGSDSGIVGLTDLNQSLAQTYAIDSQMASLYSMVFNGAHHSSISEMAVGKGNNCFWAAGDFGAHWRQANGKPVIAEVGVCHDFSARGIRAGVGIGAGSANLDLANNGASRLSGQYALAEIDWQIPESDLLLSVLGSYGQWDADLTRGYAIAGTTQSEGETDVDVVGLRARLDWQDAFHLGTVSISPRFAYTVIRSQVDAYQERSGSAPARFDERTHSAREFRAGLTGKHRLNTKTTLFGHLEAAHRFDSESARMRGSATVLGGSTLTFDETNPIERNWLRVGAEVAHQLTPSSRISISGFVASAGEDQDAGMAVSFQQAF